MRHCARTGTWIALLAGFAGAQGWFQGYSLYPEVTPQGLFSGAGDFNGDKLPDLLMQSGPNLRVWFNTGNKGELAQGPLTVLLSGSQSFSIETQIGDFTGDGLLDVALIRGFPSTTPGIVLLQGLGNGSFATVFQALEGAPWHMASGDFDGDGQLDLVALSASLPSSRVEWFRWNGAGLVPGGSASLTNDFGFDDLETMDWNGDGLDDAVLSYSNQLAVLTSTGANLVPEPLQTTGMQIGSHPFLIAGDLDGDGPGDLLLFGGFFSQQAQFFRGQAGAAAIGLAVQELGGTLPADGRAADWDGDGDLDLMSWSLIGLGPIGLYWAENTNGLQFSSRTPIELPWVGMLAGVVDLDADGHADAVGPNGVVFGKGSFETPWSLSNAGLPRLAAHDREGDGDLDRFQPGSVGLNDGTGSFPTQIAPGAAPHGFQYSEYIAIEDFTGDGRFDFLVSYSTKPASPFEPAIFIELRLLADDGLGGYVDQGAAGAPGVGIPTGGLFSTTAKPLETADLDADGDRDVIGTGTQLWLNQGTANAPWFTASTQLFANAVEAVGDVNGDGRPDLITHEYGLPHKVRIHHNLGNLQFSSGDLLWYFEIQPRPRFVDLDHDGDLDVAMSSAVAAGVPERVHLMSNEGGFFPSLVQIDASKFGIPQHYASEDVDGDGVLDLILAKISLAPGPNSLTSLSVLRGTGQPFQYQGLHSWWFGVAYGFADMDGDGDLDVFNNTGAVVNRFYNGPSAGVIRQYGAGVAGSGGAKPVLGASGPLRLGSTSAALKLVLGKGGAPSLLVVSGGEGNLPGVPALGLTVYVDPGTAVLVPAVLAGLGAGGGTLEIPIQIDASLLGLSFFHQVFSLDLSSPSLLTHSNGLELHYGS